VLVNPHRALAARDPRDERGGVLVWVVLWLPVMILFITFVVDVGNWFEHKRHLQMQADAAALAAAGDFRIPCDSAADSAIQNTALQYGAGTGATYNQQVANRQSSVHVMFNSPTYYNQSSPVDSTVVSGTPCTARMIDVKLTETDLPWYFAAGKLVPFINAHARVEIKPVQNQAGALPVGVPDVNPTSGSVTLINESTGATIATRALAPAGGAGGLTYWDNSASPFSNTVMPNAPVGVRVTLSGSTSTTCGDPLVACYDLTDPTHGLEYIRTWSSAGTAPIVHDAFLLNNNCSNSNAYFNNGCSVGLQTDVDVGANGTSGLTIEATTVGSGNNPTAYAMSNVGACSPASATCFRFRTTSSNIPVPGSAGPVPIYLHWKKTTGTWNGQTCRNGGSNPCTGFIQVQRSFSYLDAKSGPIKDIKVLESGVAGSNSFQSGTTHSLVVSVGITGSLQYASSVSDPVVALRVVGGSQNQSLDCDPNYSKLKDELAFGCRPLYTRNTGSACPGGASSLWSSAQPWQCVAVQTGNATNQVPEGMNIRVLGASKPNSCTSPNHWSQFPNLPAGDPRIVQVFLTPFGSFDGSGNTTVPVTNFATFYVTGWTGQGQGFNNPCQGNGDDPVPNNDAGYIVGHFIRYVQVLNNGGGGPGFCQLTAGGALGSGSCVAVLTQ